MADENQIVVEPAAGEEQTEQDINILKMEISLKLK